MSWILHDAENVLDAGVIENVCKSWERDPGDLFSSSHYLLESLLVWYSTIFKLDSGTAAQQVLDGSSVERGEDGRWQMSFPQPA